jgi:hypothetical protein
MSRQAYDRPFKRSCGQGDKPMFVSGPCRRDSAEEVISLWMPVAGACDRPV